MKQRATFLFGLPLSGKSTWYENNKKRFKNTIYINADDIKKEFADYDENTIGMYQQESVDIAKKRALDTAASRKSSFIFDGGGINTNYTVNLIEKVWELGYSVHLVYIDTPYYVCLERNEKRIRKVPKQIILDKEIKKVNQWCKLVSMKQVASYEICRYYSNKHLFFDMDGVMAAQIGLPVVDGKIDFVNSKYFELLPVVSQVKTIIDNLYDAGKYIYVLSAVPTSFSAEEKQRWLATNFPYIKKENIFFVSQGRYKAEMFHDLHKRLKLDKKDMTLIDDNHSILKEVTQDYKMHAMHVSYFLTYIF